MQSRSIPACAGEPYCSTGCTPHNTVYPRVCGGTRCNPFRCRLCRGLSPRVRGNLTVVRAALLTIRSIPACAGEPTVGDSIARRRWVYPRVCGGTARPMRSQTCIPGLSPRVRGNRPPNALPDLHPGSIPACAGEPSTVFAITATPTVYPRVCGGTCDQPMYIAQSSGLSPRVRGNLSAALLTSSL